MRSSFHQTIQMGRLAVGFLQGSDGLKAQVVSKQKKYIGLF
jgi:hypothetical protein